MTVTKPLNTIETLQVQLAISKARRDGRDEVEALHRADLLASRDKVKKVKLEALTAFRQSFAQWRPAEYLRKVKKSGTWTPADMYDAVSLYLDEYIKAFEEEP